MPSEGQEWWMPYVRAHGGGGGGGGSNMGQGSFYDYYFGPSARERQFQVEHRADAYDQIGNWLRTDGQGGVGIPGQGGRPDAVTAAPVIDNPEAYGQVQQFKQADAVRGGTEAQSGNIRSETNARDTLLPVQVRQGNASANASEFDTGEKNRSSMGKQEMARKLSEFTQANGRQPSRQELQVMMGQLGVSSGDLGAAAIGEAQAGGKTDELGNAGAGLVKMGAPGVTDSQATGIAGNTELHPLFSSFMREGFEPNKAMMDNQTVQQATQFVSSKGFQALPDVLKGQITTAIANVKSSAGTPMFQQHMATLAQIMQNIIQQGAGVPPATPGEQRQKDVNAGRAKPSDNKGEGGFFQRWLMPERSH